MGMKVLEFHVNPRRTGTVNRKHMSPAFQPPLPPTETGLPAHPLAEAQGMQSGVSDTSLAGAVVAPTTGTQDLLPSPGIEDPSTFKPKDSTAAATTPPLLRNGISSPGMMQTQSMEGSSKLTVGATQTTAGPSPHMARRGTKKPAPAPPKPVNLPPPTQLANQSVHIPTNQPPAISPKPVTRSPSPPTQQHSGAVQSPSYSYGSLPRRYSGSTPPIHAPNHPPPQPPTLTTPPLQVKLNSQAAVQPPVPASSEQSTEQAAYTPPQTPTFPDNSQPLQISTMTSANADLSQPFFPQTGTLPRPRPVPKPRNRPSIPPPPHPPVPNAMGESLPPSKVVTDTNSNLQAPLLEDLSPAAALGKILHNHHLTLEIENDTESTAL